MIKKYKLPIDIYGLYSLRYLVAILGGAILSGLIIYALDLRSSEAYFYILFISLFLAINFVLRKAFVAYCTITLNRVSISIKYHIALFIKEYELRIEDISHYKYKEARNFNLFRIYLKNGKSVGFSIDRFDEITNEEFMDFYTGFIQIAGEQKNNSN